MPILGYARVSTGGQDLTAQIEELEAAGAGKIFAEKQSGAKTDRPELAKALAALGAGDTLLVTRLDRVSRSVRDLLNTLATVGERGAAFKALKDPWCDTSTPHGCLMTTVLAGLAQFERSLIIARTTEGRVRALAAGTKFGRPPSLTPHQRREALDRLHRGDTAAELGRTFGVHATTISRLIA